MKLMENHLAPILNCKNPSCHGNPVFLPFPNRSEIAQDRPNWLTEDWKRFLVCQHCGQGFYYTEQDVCRGTVPNLDQQGQNYFFYIELKCAQSDCGDTIKIFRYTSDSESEAHAEKKAIAGSINALCRKGHSPLNPAKILFSCKKADKPRPIL
jgi:hypothetical protein